MIKSRYSLDQSASLAGIASSTSESVFLSPLISTPAPFNPPGDAGEKFCRYGFVDQKFFGRVTDRRPLDFGIEHNFFRHRNVRRAIHINMAVAFTMSDDRNQGICLNKTDHLLASARDDQRRDIFPASTFPRPQLLSVVSINSTQPGGRFTSCNAVLITVNKLFVCVNGFGTAAQ